MEAEDGLTTIDEEDVPLAGPGTQAQETREEDAKDSEELLNMEEEEVPLAGISLQAEKQNMNWWWLLVVVLLGGTGFEMYRRHQKKLAKVEENER